MRGGTPRHNVDPYQISVAPPGRARRGVRFHGLRRRSAGFTRGYNPVSLRDTSPGESDSMSVERCDHLRRAVHIEAVGGDGFFEDGIVEQVVVLAVGFGLDVCGELEGE